MDIRITSRPEKIWYEIDSQIGALLIAALPTVFEKVERPAPAAKPTAPRFVVFKLPTSDFWAIKVEKPNGETLFFSGNPSDAAAQLRLPVPEDVLQQYREAVNAPVVRAGVLDPFSGRSSIG